MAYAGDKPSLDKLEALFDEALVEPAKPKAKKSPRAKKALKIEVPSSDPDAFAEKFKASLEAAAPQEIGEPAEPISDEQAAAVLAAAPFEQKPRLYRLRKRACVNLGGRICWLEAGRVIDPRHYPAHQRAHLLAGLDLEEVA
jgi:hypothetical protein